MKPLYTILCIGAIVSSVKSSTIGYRLSLTPVESIENCPINQVYKECKGCDLRCEDMGAFRICPKICIPGCACVDGYVKNPEGKCVRQEDCPYPYKPFPEIDFTPLPPPISAKLCPVNEVYSLCKSCDQGCPDIDPPVMCTKDCRPGCSCKEGYVRSNGKCIPSIQCPQIDPYPEPPIIPANTDDDISSNSCPINEYFSDCMPCNDECPGFGPDACTLACRTGCSCKPGFSRYNGRCIPSAKCPSKYTSFPDPPTDPGDYDSDLPPPVTCSANQYYTNCLPCNEKCPGLEPEVCTLSCKAGCACSLGFYKDFDGSCIPSTQCPQIDPVYPPTFPIPEPPKKPEDCGDDVALPQTCPVNELFTQCMPCNEECPGFGPDICTLSCRSGCACKPGFFRSYGRCIPSIQCPQIDPMPYPPYVDPPHIELPHVEPPKKPEDCDHDVTSPPSCPANEHYTQCLPCSEDCSGFSYKSCPAICQPGCGCNLGFSRDFSGKCIPTFQCPQIDPIPILPYTGLPYPEPAVPYPAYPDPPYIELPHPKPPKNSKDCDDDVALPSSCPINQHYTNCLPCNEKCPGFGYESCPFMCQPGCACDPGYSKDFDGKCIPTFQCPQIDPYPMPQIDPYPVPQIDPYPMPQIDPYPVPQIDPYPVPQIDPYPMPHKDDNCEDDIVKPNYCPANEYFTDCTPCNENCPSLGYDSYTSCPLICTSGCACQPGFSRSNGVCIPTLQCPITGPIPIIKPIPLDVVKPIKPVQPKNSCAANEEFTTCGTCETTCESLKEPMGCIAVCIVGCQCKAGYVRDNGICIPASQCPLDSGIKPPTLPVKPSESDSPSSCPANEHYEECLPCNEKCPGFGYESCPFVCESGYACDPGFSRDFDGKCIPTIQCPQTDPIPSFDPFPDYPFDNYKPQEQSCAVNEEFTTCGGCEETCRSLVEPMMCAAVCVVGCQCKPGYVRENGECIEATECPALVPPSESSFEEESDYSGQDDTTTWDYFTDVWPSSEADEQCPVNEVFKECQSCDQTCDSLSNPIMCKMLCIPGCSCLEGYVRDNGVCIPAEQCAASSDLSLSETEPVNDQEEEEEEEEEQEPKEDTCPLNEEYKTCKGCDQNCKTLNNPIMCTMICMPGCACKPGFVRKDGACVEPSECPVDGDSSIEIILPDDLNQSSILFDFTNQIEFSDIEFAPESSESV